MFNYYHLYHIFITSFIYLFLCLTVDARAAAVWASRGQPVFGAKASPKKGGEGEEEGEDETDAHDPHFEPVVPLPDLVEVSMGEVRSG